MIAINRRQFTGSLGTGAFVLAAQGRKLFAAADLNQTLRNSMTQRKIPAVVAMVATADKITYTGAFGKRDSVSRALP